MGTSINFFLLKRELLVNYSNRLSDLGQYQQAIEFNQKSLAIYEHLAEQNPDRYEDEYAHVLSGYTIHLINLGQYSSASEQQQKANAIIQRLYQKLPVKYAFEFALKAINEQLMGWLAEQHPDVNQELQHALQYLLPHQKPTIELELLFIQGIKATTKQEQQSAFEQILRLYPQLDSANQRLTQQNRHCAAVWLEHHLPTPPQNENPQDDQLEPLLSQWQIDWTEFKQRVDGNIPQWMLDYAIRFGVQWP